MRDEEDPLQHCGHRSSERLAALKRGPSSMCPACLEEKLKAKDEALQLCLNENFSGKSTLSPYLTREIKRALKGND